MSESQSFAIATQQAHKLGKTPKNYGTSEGKSVAKAKYSLPRSSYRKTADRVKKASLLVGLQKRANVAMGMGAGASTPAQAATPMNIMPPSAIAAPRNVPQAAPKAAAPPGVAPVSTPGLPTQSTGPGAMMKSGSAILYNAFFDELSNIYLEKTARADIEAINASDLSELEKTAAKARLLRRIAERVGLGKTKPFVKRFSQSTARATVADKANWARMAEKAKGKGLPVGAGWTPERIAGMKAAPKPTVQAPAPRVPRDKPPKKRFEARAWEAIAGVATPRGRPSFVSA